MKKYHLLAFLFIPFMLIAVDFKLPDETIVGSVSQPADSIEIHKNLEAYQSFKKDDMVRYQAYLEHQENNKKDVLSSKNVYISLFSGNLWSTDFKLILKNPDHSWLNINTSAHYQKLSSDWSLYNHSILWESPGLNWQYLRPQISWLHSVFNSNSIHSKADYISVDSDNFYIESPVSSNTNLNIGFGSAKQTHKDTLGFSNNQNILDFILKSDLDIPFIIQNHSIKTGFLNKLFVYESSSDLYDLIPFIDKSALYMSVNKNFLLSLSFEKNFKLTEDLSLILKNEPYTGFESMYQQNLNNLHADLRDTGYQLQVPVNTSLTLNSYYYLPLHLSTQFEWRKNQSVYSYSNLSELYDIHYKNAMIGSIKANAEYYIKNLRLEYEIIFKKSDLINSDIKQIPFMSHLSNSLKSRFTFGHFENNTELNLISLRKDSLNQKLKNNLIMNNMLQYNWNDFFSIYLNTENLLNQKYQKYTFYPKSGIIALLGINYMF